MVIDAANGVEPQTRRLLQVCRARNTPILTFVNKMDREVQEPLALMDEIERELGMGVVPFTWPVGMAKFFGGVLDLRKQQMRVFAPGEDRDRDDDEIIEGLTNPLLEERFGAAYTQAAGEVELLQEAAPPFDEARVPGRPPDADVLRLGDQQLRRARGAGRAGRPGAAARRQGRDPARGGADRAQVHRRGLQDPGQHGPGAPRPHRLRARGQRPLRARHAAEGHALGQGAAAQHRGEFPEPAPRAAGRGLCRRHHRPAQPRRAAAGRHAHRRRGAAVHRAAVFCAGDVPLRGGGRPAAHQAAARRA